MTFPSSGVAISADTINTELNRPVGNTLSWGDSDLRGCTNTGDTGFPQTVGIASLYGFPATSIVTRNLLLHYNYLISPPTGLNNSTWANQGSAGSVANLSGVNSPGTNATSGGSVTFLRSSNQSYTFGSYFNTIYWSPTGYKGFTSITIEMWYMCTDDINIGNRCFSKPWNGSGQYNIRAAPDEFQIYGGNPGQVMVFLPQTVTSTGTNNWTHWVFWINSTSAGVYINGSSSWATTHGLTFNNDPSSGDGNVSASMGSVYPGGAYGGGNQNTGRMAQWRFYNTILTPAEIKQNFQTHRKLYNI